jgi:arsenate reductase (thioredoxin)
LVRDRPVKKPSTKGKVLFYCRCNALWSQMAEAFLKKFFPERYEACSAGMQVTPVHPMVVRVMTEIGIDVSGHRSKEIEEFVGTKFDCVALVCGGPAEVCPFFPRQERPAKCKSCAACCVHLPLFPSAMQVLRTSFNDPTKFVGPEAQSLDLFRQVRDEIRDWIIDTFGEEEIIAR